MSLADRAARMKGFVIRHRVSLQDMCLLAAAVLLCVYVMWEVDVFVAGGAAPVDHMIEPDEMPIIGTVLGLGLLIFAWRRSNEHKRDARLRLVAEQQARRLALQDPLTGLPNRRRFDDALNAAIGAPPRSGGTHALLTLDLNGFKKINDVHGHGAGDEMLRVVAARLGAAVRQGDLVARQGGDEFAVLAEQLAGAEAVTSIALRIIDSLQAPVTIGATRHQVGAGIGICLLPFAGCTADEAMRRADVALYKAKAEHKSALRFFDDEMDRLVRERDELERALQEAVANGAIEPYFQPLIDLRNNRVVGFEALARWTHPQWGPIPPDRFIPVAEDLGLIQELTDQILRASCRVALDWPDTVTLAVNVSPVEFDEKTLGTRVLDILRAAGLPPQRLELEITESALVRHLQAAREVFGPLRDAGVRIALDDFGTGYSSLYHLRNFKLDKVKIDRSFIEGMRADGESEQIVNGLIGLGHGLGLTVTAEGVSDRGRLPELLASGCQQAQGLLFGMAVPAAATRDFFVAAPSYVAAG